ncbi:MAG TPA: TetR/AcrR family transcriptional regulator [Candidatus Didemnitutus sp.]|nr:TetR/AcrR family transcriptional regulator [Candidatus Didemnitutus sp.]
MSKPDPSTKARLLATALDLFAAKGFDGLDIRELTAQANANLAAVGYHFHGKAGLYRAVLQQAIFPLCHSLQLNLEELDAGFFSAESIVDTYLASADGASSSAGRLFRRCLTDPVAANVPPDDHLVLQQTLAKLSQAFRRLAPPMPATAFLWRLTLFVGAANHALDHLPRMSELTRGICRDNDHNGVRNELVNVATTLFSSSS